MINFDFLPELLHDESLLGYMSRVRATLPFATNKPFISQFKNSWQSVITTRLASGIEMEISEVVRRHFDLPVQPYWTHGSGRYFRPFLNQHGRRAIQNIFDQNALHPMQFVTKFAKEGKVAWGWCPCCVKEDTEIHGVAYWHLSHQIPAVRVCPRHQCEIVRSCPHCKCSTMVLSLGELPPQNSICGKCNTLVEAITPKLNKKTQWISSRMTGILDLPEMFDPQIIFAHCITSFSEQRINTSPFYRKVLYELGDYAAEYGIREPSRLDLYEHVRDSLLENGFSGSGWPNPLIWMLTIVACNGREKYDSIVEGFSQGVIPFRPATNLQRAVF